MLQACLLAAFGSRALEKPPRAARLLLAAPLPAAPALPAASLRAAHSFLRLGIRSVLLASGATQSSAAAGDCMRAGAGAGAASVQLHTRRTSAAPSCSTSAAAAAADLRGSPWFPARAAPPAALLLGCRIENRSWRVERSRRDGQSAEQLEGQGYLFFHLFSLSF